MIDGLILTKLKKIPHEKGDIFHAMKSSDSGYAGFGEAYFSEVNFREIKGWKKHSEMVLNLVVPLGRIKFVAYDDRPLSSTYGEFYQTELSADNYCRLTVPHGIWLSFQGIGESRNLLLNLASIPHDPNESEVKSLNDIRFEW
ncbi:dTDP-4-dehydrorhamnose 3,5-epimerase family protein [Motilimonas sp. E26]|uniref:dTDP-4-dehydrorhamnose 3,5-epimerase family protein n=1 Tax=Motilimonas sp. E26 TaxID=2865674 RepID=UPI001E4708DC|nr:dTDP-4-dehydrorhamnose 3,5-epimerase family protein [Motilimonas sp. E26]MCE0558576.1 dTDP-4-dehydrorhamnose 3,5-epimerase family protein [Motilimonas sp. E26]